MQLDKSDPAPRSSPRLAPPAATDRRFFGQPAALGFLAFTEAWERFSFYGMTSILVLYMTQALFTPDRMARIWGFAPVRQFVGQVFGAHTTLALASQMFGLYTGLVYFTPVIGGWLADRFLGRRRAVMVGAAMMTAGHVAMAFDQSFLLALLLLILGCGLLKGNISAQVGMLYAPGDGAGRTAGFAIFSMGINVGAIAGPLAIGFLADRFGWHVGFALAGVLMLLGLLTYAIGYRLLPGDAIAGAATLAEPPAPVRLRTVAALVAVMGITVFHSIAFYQNSNIGLIWIQAHVDLTVGGFRVPVSWFNAIDPTASILFVPPLFAWWKRRETKGRRGDEIRLIASGAWIAAAANALLALASMLGPRSSILFPIAYDLLLGISFLYYWPTLLALVSKTAPGRINATMVGSAFLSLFLAYSIIGSIGGWYEQLGPTRFWLLNTAIACAGGLLATLLRRPLMRALAPPSNAAELALA